VEEPVVVGVALGVLAGELRDFRAGLPLIVPQDHVAAVLERDEQVVGGISSKPNSASRRSSMIRPWNMLLT